MKNNSINYVVAGLFVLAMLGGAIVAIATLSGKTGPTDAYFTEYRDVSGIKFGTKVLYMGYPVGQVEDIEPDWDDHNGLRFKLKMSISDQWRGRMPEDSIAEVRAGGLLSAVALDIRAGSSDQYLSPGDSVRGLERTDLFSAMTAAANTIKDLTEHNIKPLIQNFSRYVHTFGAVLEKEGSSVVTDLSVVAADLSESTPEMIDSFMKLSRDIHAMTARLQVILGPENSDKISRILSNAETATENVAALTADEKIDQTLVNVSTASQHLESLTRNAEVSLDELLGQETVDKLRASLDDIGQAARNVANLSRDLRESRERLEHFLETLDGVATENRDDIRESAQHLRHTMEIIDDHIGTIAYNLEGTSRNMREFSRQLRQNPGSLLGGKPPSDAATY